MKVGTILVAVVLFLILLIIWLHHEGRPKEGYRGANYSTANDPLLTGSYPVMENPHASNNTYSKIWWKYPEFSVGSFKQITNNVRYNYNPDDGICIPAEMCGALYHNKKKTTSNVIGPLGPVPSSPGIRVGYYRTQHNLLMSNRPGPLLELPSF